MLGGGDQRDEFGGNGLRTGDRGSEGALAQPGSAYDSGARGVLRLSDANDGCPI